MSSDSQQMFPVMAPDHFHQYSNAWPQHSQQVSVRQYPSTSSAFSSSAHPDEDWTKVSDLAERRRIQNRIAQRNYRKKIKERMADLERRAGTEGTKSQTSTKKLPKSSKKSRRQSSPPPTTSDTLAPPHQVPHNPFTPPMHPEDHFFPSPSPPASTPPSSSNYHSTYSPPSDSGLIMPPFGSPQSQPMSTTAPYQFGMVTTTAPTLPPMNFFADAYKAPNLNGGNESMSSFPGYGDYTLGVPPSHYDSNPHTPSLSPCLEHSECISEAGWSAYPATPLSMGSP